MILSFIPLALAAITPAMLVVVAFLLSMERGLLRAGLFMAGRLLTYLGWCAALFIFADRVFDLTLEGSPAFSFLIRVIIGLLLVGMALKVALGGEDPDALPAKVVNQFEHISLIRLFGLGVLVSLFQVRHVMLLFVGISEIVVSELSLSSGILATVILILMINASQLFLMAVYLVLADRADAFILASEAWLTQNNRRVAAIIGLIGIFLLWDGLRGLSIFG